MSTRHPVSFAARRAFWPSRPIASETLIVRHDHRCLASFVVDQHLTDAGRRQRLGDEPGGLLVVGKDVDLLAAELRDDHPDARTPRADAGADRVDAVGV